MPFTAKSGKFNASIKTVTIGTGDKAITLGGESSLPFQGFDAPIVNAPKVGIEITDFGMDNEPECIKKYYEGCTTIGEIAKKAASFEGVDFLSFRMEGADPNGADKATEDLVAMIKEIADAVDCPLVICGCKNAEKDAELLTKAAEAVQGKNALILAAKEENYKTVGAAAGLAYNQIVGAESSVDINLAKQLNVLLSQLGVKTDAVIMNIGTASAGYGYEYVASTMQRIKAAALSQNDAQLQMPIITPVASETWATKEATSSEADIPEWGCQEKRGIDMEVETAAADLACGSDCVILKHPVSVATISKMIK